MPNRRYSQVYIRYLKARLLNFLRPSFWGTGIFLVVLGFVIRELWFNTQSLTQIENQEVGKELLTSKNTNPDTKTASKQQITEETLLSNEDKAIAADIDNMPNLLSDVTAAANILSANIITSDNNRSAKKKPLLKNVINQQNSQPIPEVTNNTNKQIEILNNPFLDSANTLLKSNDYYASSQSAYLHTFPSSESKDLENGNNLVINLNYQNVNNKNHAVITPLEAAMKRSIHTNPINNNGLNLNSQIGYFQSTANLPKAEYKNFNAVQTPANLGITIPTNEISNIPISNVGNSPNLLQSTNQDTVNLTTPLGYQNSINYKKNSSYGLQQPNQSQLPNSNLYGNPVQVPSSFNEYQR